MPRPVFPEVQMRLEAENRWWSGGGKGELLLGITRAHLCAAKSDPAEGKTGEEEKSVITRRGDSEEKKKDKEK